MQNILKNSRIVLIIGLSRHNNKDSNVIAQYLLKNIGIINIFRPSTELVDIIKQIIQLKELRKSVIWNQMGISDKRAEEVAIKNNIKIIMNKCIKIEHSNIN